MDQFGYFGKTIHSDDFVNYNLPQVFLDVWRDWVDVTLAASERNLADQWPEIYRKAGRYFFSISAGVAGNTGWAGIFAPSTDAFGRRYPFCFATTIPATLSPVDAFNRCNPWLNAANSLLDELMDEDFNSELLNDMVRNIANSIEVLPAKEGGTFSSGLPCADGTISIFADSSCRLHDNGAKAMLGALLASLYYQYSVWTSIPDQQGPQATLLVSGMPSAQQGTALFDNKWHNRGFATITRDPVSAAN